MGDCVRVDAALIAGPTASGKSALALALAREAKGVVINADSMQVYRDLRILTARPKPEEEAAVPHRLYGVVDGAENFSAGRWLSAVGPIIADARQAGRLPIIVGGTGLYFKALTQGLSDIPAVPAEVRAAVRAEAAGRPAADLHAELALRDPATAATLRPSDPQRILRALEVHAATGRPLSDFHGARAPALLDPGRCAKLFLVPDRARLREAIDRRFDTMMKSGALDEVRALISRQLDRSLPVMRAHGVPGLVAHLDGALSLEEAIAKGQADTRAYARRQMTWFRHQMEGWTAASADVAASTLRRLAELHP
ncbi:MAG: tRNA (adenosine(37)-N6)-dimethylallyltransferase MiaA [Beijerinckiaceae bacterium]